jgi:hypothetical protein
MSECTLSQIAVNCCANNFLEVALSPKPTAYIRSVSIDIKLYFGIVSCAFIVSTALAASAANASAFALFLAWLLDGVCEPVCDWDNFSDWVGI